ncbi:hypothetical protein OF376_00925 [Ureaplasma miroungigenitalium]|uniref:Uncharacterized protein n=1 Tax=Ureaplasma miroungigenitalium TaxID=1042321 RepID=A0ABT3BMI3_9BACT|nr:hypothetical protein [Ureaplasma miroungigenitalium]MCV3728347.1 hypothetical protein [Ureaplasma miroungigenitalium]
MNKTFEKYVELTFDEERVLLKRGDNQIFRKPEETSQDNVLDPFIKTDGLNKVHSHHDSVAALIINNNEFDTKGVENYRQDIEDKVTELYEDITSAYLKSKETKKHKKDVPDVINNQKMLNNHIQNVQTVCNRLAFEWDAHLLTAVSHEEFLEVEKVKVKSDKLLKRKLRRYYQLINHENLDTDFTDINLTPREQKIYDKISASEEEKTEMLRAQYDEKRNDVIDAVWSDLLIHKKNINDTSFANSSSIALLISGQFGLINDLEKLLNEQELLRIGLIIKRTKLQREKLNNYYEKDEVYEQDLYALQLEFLKVMGAEITILSAIEKNIDLLERLLSTLKQADHPLASYGNYVTMLTKISKMVANSAKNAIISSDNEERFVHEIVLDETGYKNDHEHDEVITNTVYKQTKIIPDYHVNVVTNEPRDLFMNAYVNEIPVSVKIKKK